eukprot:8258302-Alexandrium_andersonii.AAC.1
MTCKPNDVHAHVFLGLLQGYTHVIAVLGNANRQRLLLFHLPPCCLKDGAVLFSVMLVWIVGTPNYRHARELRASGKAVARDGVASDLARLVGSASVASAAAVTEGNEYTHRLLGVALLSADVLHDPAQDVMQLLSRVQRDLLEYWSPRWETVPGAKVQFAKATHSARCISEVPCFMHVRGSSASRLLVCFAELSASSVGRALSQEVVSDDNLCCCIRDLPWFPRGQALPRVALLVFPLHGLLVASGEWRHVAWP